jgi:ketosteroid isomerase-like protein
MLGMVASALSLPLIAARAEQPDAAHAAAELAEAQNRELVEAAFARWAAGGAGFFDEMLSEHVVWTIAESGPSAGTFRGRESFLARAVRPFAHRLAEPVRPVATRIWADREHVIIKWEGAGVALDGQPYRNSYAWIFRMRDGRAAEVTAFLELTPYDDVLRRISLADKGD